RRMRRARVLLDDQVVDAVAAQRQRRRQPGRPGPDDQYRDGEFDGCHRVLRSLDCPDGWTIGAACGRLGPSLQHVARDFKKLSIISLPPMMRTFIDRSYDRPMSAPRGTRTEEVYA